MLKSFGAIGLALLLSACAVHSPDREFLAVAVDSSDNAVPTPPLVRTIGTSSVLFGNKDQPVTLLTASTRDINDPRARSPIISYAKQTVDLKNRITIEDVDQNTFLAAVRGQLGEGFSTTPGDVMVFVHGFNNKEKDAVTRAKTLVNAISFRGVPVAFTWPSFGGGWGTRYYLYDLQSSTFSRDELVALLQSLASEGAVGRIHLVGHSMGCWLAMEALRQTSIAQQANVLSKLSSIILLAPDIDEDVFDSQVAAIGPLARRIAVFAGTDDRALAVSAALAAAPRLGKDSVIRLRDRYGASGILFFDTSGVKADGLIRHFKGDSPVVATAIAKQIAGSSDAAYAQR
jgi:esterase/lipase superfamily enzyme